MQNQEADDLTNEDFSRFDPSLRVGLNMDIANFPTMFKMLDCGQKLFEVVEEHKAANKKRPRRWPKVALAKRLRNIEPW